MTLLAYKAGLSGGNNDRWTESRADAPSRPPTALRSLGITVATGIFQAMMSVELVNEGPVTILIDSDKTF